MGIEDIEHRYSDFVGEETTKAYAEILDGRIIDRENDEGKDLEFRDGNRLVRIQIKSSYEYFKKFLAKSLHKAEFIPLCFGEPGSKEEIIKSLRRYGAWIEKDFPNRQEILEGVAKVRKLCYAGKGQIEEALEAA